METKICSKCGLEKSLSDFHIVKNHGKPYRRPQCILCYRVKNTENYRNLRRRRQLKKHPPISGEIWKDFLEYNNYEVSSLGRIRNKNTGKLLSGRINEDGYRIVKLTYKKYHHDVWFTHRVVAFVFIKNPRKHKEVNHKDGNKLNNSVENLEWCDRQHNMRHAFDNGLGVALSGTKSGASKLKIDDINKIFTLYESGMSYSAIGRVFNVKHNTISSIVKRVTWKHLLKNKKGLYYEP